MYHMNRYSKVCCDFERYCPLDDCLFKHVCYCSCWTAQAGADSAVCITFTLRYVKIIVLSCVWRTVKMSADPGEYVVLLADRNLLELPLESLSILREEGLSAVTRDFSLQLFYSRLKREEQKGTDFEHAYISKHVSAPAKDSQPLRGTCDFKTRSQLKSDIYTLQLSTFVVFQCYIKFASVALVSDEYELKNMHFKQPHCGSQLYIKGSQKQPYLTSVTEDLSVILRPTHAKKKKQVHDWMFASHHIISHYLSEKWLTVHLRKYLDIRM